MKFLLLLLILSQPLYAKHYHTKKYHHKHAKGLKRHYEKHGKFLKKSKHVSYLKDVTPIPASADISAKVSPPEDQGQCGSCWDFSLTKALRSAYMVQGKDPGVLEFNYLLNNCGPGTKEYGCNGGDFAAADNFQNGYGPGLNSNNPYTQSGGSCKNLSVSATVANYYMLGSGTGPSFKDLAYATGVLGQMASIDVAVVGDWEDYDGGVYDGCTGGPRNINHMINLVGYDCETSKDEKGNCVFDDSGNPKNGDGWIKVENNWNTTWGESGYMRTRYMVRGRRCNAVATTALLYTLPTTATR